MIEPACISQYKSLPSRVRSPTPEKSSPTELAAGWPLGRDRL